MVEPTTPGHRAGWRRSGRRLLCSDLLEPKGLVAVSRPLDKRQALGHQLFWREAIQRKATRYDLVEVSIVRCVAKHASRNDVVGVVAVGVALGQEVVPGQREPGSKGQRSIQSAIAALEPIPAMNLERVPSKGIPIGRHYVESPMKRRGWSFIPASLLHGPAVVREKPGNA
jgi:hypothetical protein